MKAKVIITLKNGVLDPQGDAVKKSLQSLGFDDVEKVRIGKYIEVETSETDKGKAKEKVEKM
ncbi:MAG: phosphoribosylformylglycinamidine synthase subunit PurS [Nitrospinae bacterium]|nr:phosphoribosylformylglycinamidine synthase subunit PurS [Nitrospinota bacterium]